MYHSKQAVEQEIIIDQGVSKALDSGALNAVAGGFKWYGGIAAQSYYPSGSTDLGIDSKANKAAPMSLLKF